MATLTTSYQKLSELNIGSFGYGTLYLRLYGKYDKQNIANNTTTYTLQTRIYCSGSYCYSGNCYAYIDGTTVQNNTSLTFPTNGELTLGSKTITVTHESDGKKTQTKSASFSCYALSGGSVSATFTLPTIPRASTIACTTANIGETAIITIDRKANTFIHTITYAFGTLSGTIVTKTSNTTLSWTIPTTFYAQIPNAKTGTGTLKCTTYDSNGNTVGSATSIKFTVTVNTENNKPTVTISAIDTGITLPTGVTTTSLTGSNKKLINNWSSVKVTATTTAKNSATIKSTTVKCGDGQTSTSLIPTFTKVHNKDFSVIATDSRGISNSVSTSDLSLIEYTEIQTTEFVLKRIAQTSGTIKLSLKGKYFNGSFGSVTNDITLKYRYKETGGAWSSYTTLALTKSNGAFSYSNEALLTGLDYQKAYVFEIVLTDKVNIYTITSNDITKGIPIVDYGENDFRVNGGFKTQILNSGCMVGQPTGTITNTWFKVASCSFSGSYTDRDITFLVENTFNDIHESGILRIRARRDAISSTSILTNIDWCSQTAYINESDYAIAVLASGETTNVELWCKIDTAYTFVHFTVLSCHSRNGLDDSWVLYNSTEPSANITDGYTVKYSSSAVKGLILYNNTTGTTGTVTLSQSAEKFNYLEIFYRRNANLEAWSNHFYTSTRIDAPNGKIAPLSVSYPAETTTTQISSKLVLISGTSITVQRECYANIVQGSAGQAGTQTQIFITKVVGYK